MAEKSDQHHHHHNWDQDFCKFYSERMENKATLCGIALSKMLKAKEAKTILEIGCGSGELSLYLLQNLPSGVKYTSLDVSEAMIALANQKKEVIKNKLNNIDHTFVARSAEDLSFIPDESVDVIMAPLVLHHIPDYNKAIREALRVLKKGGRIGFVEKGPEEKSTWLSLSTKITLMVQGHQHSGEHHHQHSGEHHHHSGEHHHHQHSGEHHHHHHSGEHHDKTTSGYDDQTGHFGPQNPFNGTKEGLIKLAQAHGIKVDYCWEAEIPIDSYEEDYVKDTIENPRFANVGKGIDEEQLAKVKERLKKVFNETTSNNTPLMFDAIYLVGRKPE